ncbi:hypothetical protein [Paractinoplanes rishiriensis]|uniref:DUF4913 domain-containing protein n=1 Tax=Paractinoplanes rishiriensis TaxID=1050105 RepID=A0A919K837_9ACTN|nr:hypothetical protein [Actinoplanes rishiriensis]GIF01103.1 hypothetical protein Ari01nite_85670 [Actinoplanes rishiriensis]
MTRDIDRDRRTAANLARLGGLLGVHPNPRPTPARPAPAAADNVDALFATARATADAWHAAEHRRRWHTQLTRWRQHRDGGPRPLLVQYPPPWMSYLLWHSRHTHAWVLELRDRDGLTIIDNNPHLARGEVYAAQTWAHTRGTGQIDEPFYTWLPVTVTGRRGWTPLHDPHWRRNPLFHDLHPRRRPEPCCSWNDLPAPESAQTPGN